MCILRYITKESKIPIVCEETFAKDLQNTLLLFNLMNYIVGENPCLPEVTLRIDAGTYTCYEIEDISLDWVATIVLHFDQLKRQKKKLKTGKLKMTDTYNVLYSVELQIPCDEYSYSTSEKYEPQDEMIFERLKQIIGI